MHWQNITELTQALENCFQQIQQQRMTGLNILNPKLQVQAVDFQWWQQGWLGILISPWFINILYFRNDNLSAGAKIIHDFPAGRFEFIVAHEHALGYYQNCSLYSPVLEFDNQSAAVQAAKSALSALLYIPQPILSRRQLLRGHFNNQSNTANDLANH